jgi:hypothetical protein
LLWIRRFPTVNHRQPWEPAEDRSISQPGQDVDNASLVCSSDIARRISRTLSRSLSADDASRQFAPPRYTPRRPSLTSTEARSIRKYLDLVGFPGNSRTSFSSSLSADDASSEFGAVPYQSEYKCKSSALPNTPSLGLNEPAVPVPSILPPRPKPMGPRARDVFSSDISISRRTSGCTSLADNPV